MKFLTQAIHGPPPSTKIVDVLRQNLAKPQKERSHKETHASDLTKDHWCPREVAIMDMLKMERGDVKPGMAQAACWDVGNVLADLVREKWLGPVAIGNWRCLRCNQLHQFGPKPGKGGCMATPSVANMYSHVWRYEEVKFWSVTYGFSGSLDVILDLGGKKLTICELKTIDKDEFGKLAAPYAEHRVRTNLYMKLVEDSDHPARDKIDVQQAKILYVMKGFGKKSESGEVHPFKEFDIARDDSSLGAPLSRASAINDFRTKGIVPKPLGNGLFCPEAKGCKVAQHCLSGKVPQAIHLTDGSGSVSLLPYKVGP